MRELFIVIIVCIVSIALSFFYLRHLLFKCINSIATMPVMKWIPFDDICYQYFDNSKFWTQMILLSLMKGKAIEARPMEGFENEGIENPTFEELQYHAAEMMIYEFRLTYRPRKKRKIKLTSRDWFEQDPVVQPA